jgi:hypothetical protein
MGGAKRYHTLYRDWGCPLVGIGLTMLLFKVSHLWWCYFIYFGLSWLALSTYYDEIFGYDNYYVHGLGCGLAAIPLYWVGVAWWILLLHLIVCTLGMGLWSAKIKNAIWEECGRGVFFIL